MVNAFCAQNHWASIQPPQCIRANRLKTEKTSYCGAISAPYKCLLLDVQSIFVFGSAEND